MVADVEAKLGPIEVLVCNAARMTMMPFLEQTPEQWWEQIHVNLTGHMDLITAVAPRHAQAGSREDRPDQFALGTDRLGERHRATLRRSRRSSRSGARSARELAPEHIYVTVVAPGIIDTPQLQVDADDAGVSLQEMHAIYAKGIPAGASARPTTSRARSSSSRPTTAGAYVGQTIHPNGGEIRCSM